MDLRARLRSMVKDAPPGALIQLPADWLRAELAAEADGERATPDADAAPHDYTVQEIADKERRSTGTVRQWIRAGLLAAYPFRGKEYRVTAEAYAAFLDAQRTGGKAGEQASPVAPGSGGSGGIGGWREVRKRAA